MTFTALKIAFNICTRVKRHVHVQAPWRQLGVNNMSSNVVQQNFSQLIPCVCTYSLTHVHFLLVFESVDSSCAEMNECSFAYLIISKDHQRTWPRLDLAGDLVRLFSKILTRDLVTQIAIIKYFMYLGTHLGVVRSSWIHRSPNFVRKISSH